VKESPEAPFTENRHLQHVGAMVSESSTGWWLVSTPLKNMTQLSWDDFSIQLNGKSVKIPWFQTTNQL
jgi:hypothetical protein